MNQLDNTPAPFGVFGAEAFHDHEQIVYCRDPHTGLRAIIALHDTSLGPAVGGCRLWPYASEEDALRDVLRLSRGMSYKNALAGLPLGGGKAVILSGEKNEPLLRSFGRFVHSLGGRYISAEDVGIDVSDIDTMAMETPYVTGRSEGPVPSGNPSPFTARGAYLAIRAALNHRHGQDALRGKRVAVQGLGSVGSALCRLLHEDGASIIATDIDERAVQKAREGFGAEAVVPDAIYDVDADVFAPCALGAILNEDTIPRLRTEIVAGAANNQLADERDGERLRSRHILYAPDFVGSAGGVINGSFEILGRYDAERVLDHLQVIPRILGEVFARSEREGLATNKIANEMAEERLAQARMNRHRAASTSQKD